MSKAAKKPVGKLVPLYPGSKLFKDEEGTWFNKSGNRRGLGEVKDDSRKRIAQEHNWAKLKVTGAISNLRHTLYNLTPAPTDYQNTLRQGMMQRIKGLEVLLLQEVEASREQAKKNLKD